MLAAQQNDLFDIPWPRYMIDDASRVRLGGVNGGGQMHFVTG
ncbi:MAG: hypothetical protein AAGH88_10290 [Planctomycetota bacterium]